MHPVQTVTLWFTHTSSEELVGQMDPPAALCCLDNGNGIHDHFCLLVPVDYANSPAALVILGISSIPMPIPRSTSPLNSKDSQILRLVSLIVYLSLLDSSRMAPHG